MRGWRGNPPQPGDTIWPGQPIAEIPELARMQAEVFVLEADAGGLAADQPARVTIEARGGVEIAGQVERVDKVAKPRVRNVPVQYFGATLSLAATDAATMKPGQRVVARVEVVALPRALVVPRTAVFEEGESGTASSADAGARLRAGRGRGPGHGQRPGRARPGSRGGRRAARWSIPTVVERGKAGRPRRRAAGGPGG